MSNKQTPRHVNGSAVDLGASARQAMNVAEQKAKASAEIADAFEQARGIDTLASAQRLPSGHVMLPRFPDGELVTIDAKRVAFISPLQPEGWVDLSKLGEDRPSICEVTYEYGTVVLVGTVAEITGLLLGGV